MQVQRISLTMAPSTRPRHIDVFRFGQPGSRPKVYIQGGLHADEAPGIAVSFALHDRLVELERSGSIRGEIVLVPVANPIGRDQMSELGGSGRFETLSGQNFNRNFPDAAALLLAENNRPPEKGAISALRNRMVAAVQSLTPANEFEQLQRELLALAIDADIVLDMHCDSEAVKYLFCHSEQATDAAELGQMISAYAVLHAELQGGHSFDEACTLPWVALRKHWPHLGLPIACFAVTLEWRGQHDVDAGNVARDAQGVLAWLRLKQVLNGEIAAPEISSVTATPLAAVEVIRANHHGIVMYDAAPGTMIKAGDILGRLLALDGGPATPVRAGTSGLLYAREKQRVVAAGTELFFIAGHETLREGMLLSA